MSNQSLPSFRSYGEYSSGNYGAHCLMFTIPGKGEVYFSYQTPVAFRGRNGLVVRENDWGPTTGKHLNWIDGGNKNGRIPGDEFERRLAEQFEDKPTEKFYSTIYYSRRDIYGNVYWAMAVERASDGKTAHGTISGGESNCTWALRALAEKHEAEEKHTVHELPIRQYNRMVKDWPYIGCTDDEIIPNIEKQFESE
jgi:hypothetical protein